MSACISEPARVWRREADAKALLAWRDEELYALAAAVREVLARWRRDWGLPAGGEVRCACMFGTGHARAWQPLGANGQAAAWCVKPPDIADQVAVELFGRDEIRGPLACEVTAECVADLFTRFLAAWALGPAQAAQAHPSRWSGAVEISLDLGVLLLLDAQAAAAIVRRSASRSRSLVAVTPVQQAIARSPVPVQVRLDGCELDVGSLQDLRIGDVLRIAHRLDRPARVETPAGASLFAGFLARAGGRKAVELSPAPNS